MDELTGIQIVTESSGKSIEEPEATGTEPAGRPKAFRVIHPVNRIRRRAATTRVEFPLGILAGLLGIVSLGFVWSYELGLNSRYDVFTALRYISDMDAYDPVYSAIVLLILVGSILCFFTAIGSLLQLGGVLLYAFDFVNDSVVPGPGPFVAVAATLVGIASLLVSSNIKVPSRFVTLVLREKGGLSVNVLSLSAFVMGLLSVLLIWVVQQYSLDSPLTWEPPYTPPTEYYSLLSFLTETRVEDPSLMIAGSSLLVLGSVLCLLTPLGSFAQMVGGAICFLEIRSSFVDSRYAAIWSVEVDIGAGAYVAVVAAAVGLLSMVYAMRIRIPGRFAPGALLLLRSESDLGQRPPAERDSGTSRPHIACAFLNRAPRMLRALAVVAVILFLIISALAVPSVVPLSEVKLEVSNASPLCDIQLEVYVDGEAVASGVVSPFNKYIFGHKVKSGIHTLGLDYAFSNDTDPIPDGFVDWSSSVDVDPYMTSVVIVPLMGDMDVRAPQANLSSESSSDGCIITIESVTRYSQDGWTYCTDIDWSSVTLVVVEAYSSGASWGFHGYELDDVPYDLEYCGIEYLGSLALNCTAYDISGDGEAGAGDFIRLSVDEGEFSSSSEYIAYLLYEPYDSVIGQVTVSG